jgi:hypothetical protein
VSIFIETTSRCAFERLEKKEGEFGTCRYRLMLFLLENCSTGDVFISDEVAVEALMGT